MAGERGQPLSTLYGTLRKLAQVHCGIGEGSGLDELLDWAVMASLRSPSRDGRLHWC